MKEFDNFDEQCSLDEEPKTKSGQKVARKQLSDTQLNFHDFSEETYNSNNDQGKNIKKILSDIGDYSQKLYKYKCTRCDVKGVFSKPSGNLILGPDFCLLS